MLNPNSGFERARWQRDRLEKSGLSRQARLASLLIFLLLLIGLGFIALHLLH